MPPQIFPRRSAFSIKDIDGKYIIGMRNLITHRYFDGDMWILWNRGSSTTKTPIENNYRQIRSF
jgi:uncharacterized protein with HEPN domain